MRIFRSAFLAVACTALALCGHNGWSQTTGTIKIIVPVPAGGSPDIVARLLVDQIGRAHGPAMVILNRPGAGTAIATETASRAAPDGTTLLVNAPPFLINAHLRKLDYDPLTSFEPICCLTRSPLVIVVNSASSYHTLADLLDAARAKPAGLTLAGIAPATVAQIGFEMLKRAANVNITFVPYPSMGSAVNSLLGNHVTAAFGNYGDVFQQVKAGKLRALAIASRTRMEFAPDLPTIAESGYPEYELDVWSGLVAPAKTPTDTISQLIEWTSRAIQAPEFKSKLAPQGIYPVGICGADFAAFLRKRDDEYRRVIRDANIRVE